MSTAIPESSTRQADGRAKTPRRARAPKPSVGNQTALAASAPAQNHQRWSPKLLATVPSIKMALAEYAGVRGSDSLDQHAKSDGEGTAATSGTTPPTTQNDELWIGVIANAAGLSQCNPTNGFERVQMSSDGASTLALFDRIVSASDSAGLSVTFRGFDCTDNGAEFPTEFAGAVATFRR